MFSLLRKSCDYPTLPLAIRGGLLSKLYIGIICASGATISPPVLCFTSELFSWAVITFGKTAEFGAPLPSIDLCPERGICWLFIDKLTCKCVLFAWSSTVYYICFCLIIYCGLNSFTSCRWFVFWFVVVCYNISILGANSEPYFPIFATFCFLDDDESGMTVGLLKVLHDCRLICCVIIIPAIIVWFAVDTCCPALLIKVPFGVGMAEPTADWFVISYCCGTPRLLLRFSKNAVWDWF